MNTLLLRSCTVLGLLALGACAQTAPSAPPGPPVVNATPPPLPPDPALGPHATPAQEPAQRARRR